MIIKSLNKILVLICLCSSHYTSAQIFYKIDTLKYSHRIGGALDSVDKIVGIQSNTLPGGGWNSFENVFSNDFWFINSGGMQYYDFYKAPSLRFSGLPHIGFAYSFGSSGSQFAKAEYQQQLKNGLLINLDYNKLRSNGMLRSGMFDHNNTALQLFRPSNFWTTYLSGTFASSNISLNDGLLIDSLNNEFDLQFIPVRKENANALTQRTSIDWWNYFDFYKDSTRALGLYLNNKLKIKKFAYDEQSDTLAQMYNQINLDSTETNDQFQWSQVGMGVGGFFSSPSWYLNAGVDVNYWNFQNIGLFRDTVELNLSGNIIYHLSDWWYIQDSVNINFLGAENGIANMFIMKGPISRLIDFKGFVKLDNKLADYHQRYAFGNNYNANFTNFKYYKFYADASLSSFIGGMNVRLGFSQNLNSGDFWFIDNSWRNDSIVNLIFNRSYLKLDYGIKKIKFEAFYQFCNSKTAIKYLPKHIANLRVSYKAKVFKAGKMQVYTGFDFTFVSRYERISFLPHVLSWDLSNSYGLGSAYTNLHWFGGFQIDEFRFFARAENLGGIWTDRNIEIQNGYPIGGLQLRVGITWDFFN
jgi:hypothetical protein